MPVDPNYIYADQAHEKTVRHAGWTYGCHSSKVGPGPRGEASTISVQDGWTEDGRRVMRPHVTEWLTINHEGKPMYCGHLMRLTDPQCTGCVNRRDE